MEILYHCYCKIHKILKTLRNNRVSQNDIVEGAPVKFKKGVSESDAIDFWKHIIYSSVIPDGEFKGFMYAGFLKEKGKWVLDSWIWTNAAIIKALASIGDKETAVSLGDKLLYAQQECGGWIVRYDYDRKGAIPMLAPNDSAYIANNAMLTLYKCTGNDSYLQSACRCADWIMKTCRPDGMVYIGYNTRDNIWDKNCVIVDVGFTAGLFARLYEITKNDSYLDFLKNFTCKYIELFYIPEKHGFCTSIDSNDHHQGGMFGRGQAWALEGLIPAYRVLGDVSIKKVIDATIDNLIKNQCSNGGWPYNLTRKLMGEDCKATSVIAKAIIDWYELYPNKKYKDCCIKALEWCRENTACDTDVRGGIFSFCLEGAIVHNLYTSCAFVYASAYAIELKNLLENGK